MGITGLIPFLEKASKRVHLKDMRGSTIAVDSYCWLHKGAFGCAEKIARGEDTDVYVTYCMRYVLMLLAHDIKPILVFDGRHLPAKALTESRRREIRKTAKKQAAELMRQGRYEEGRAQLRRSVDVTHEMALRVIRECRERNVDCVVAPYEADAQMAWLNKVGIAQYIVTEDSDLTLFGAQNIIFKLDLTGNGLLVEADKLHLAMGCRPEKYTFDKFRRMCILSGCDYLDSLPGIGLAKACKFILKTEEDNMWRALKKIPQYLNMRQLEVTDEYIENFLKAEATFKHMYIYNPLKRKMERLNELDEFQTEERFCANAGILLDDEEQAFQLALGNLNPFTLKQLDNWHPDKRNLFGEISMKKSIKPAKHKSIWQNTSLLTSYTEMDINRKTKSVNSCALYFRKVDFISKTIDEDVNANLREEIAKPREADIFSMYRREAVIKEYCETDEPSAKRRRSSTLSNSSATLTDAGDDDGKYETPVTPTKSHNNPFARVYNSVEERLRKSPICESSSLLGALSPKKSKELIERARCKLKRPYCDDVEVKSRFFASNVEQVASAKVDERLERSVTDESGEDLTEEIERIETKSYKQLQHSAQIAQLYRSPSPTTQNENVKLELENSVKAGRDLVSSVEVVDNKNIVKLDDAAKIVTHEQKISTAITREIKPLEITSFNPRRLGLCKPKKATNKTKPTVADKAQTRLSMFGFQKRPTLK